MASWRRTWHATGRSVRTTLLALCATIAVSRSAVAFDDAAKAESLKSYQVALADYQAARYRQAAEGFQRALDAVQLPVLALWTARANARKGDLLRAASAYQQATQLTPNELWFELKQQRAQVEAADELKALRVRIPSIRIEAPVNAESDAVVTLDGVIVEPGDYIKGLSVNPGKHEAKLVAGGKVITQNVSIAEGQTLLVRWAPEQTGSETPTVRLGLSPDAHGRAGQAPRTTMKLPKAEEGSRYVTASLVSVAIGAAGISAGAVMRFLALDEQSTINAHCDKSKRCDPIGMDAVSRADSLQTQSTIFLLVGLAGLGTGVGLAIAGSSRSNSETPTLTAWAMPEGASLTLRRRF